MSTIRAKEEKHTNMQIQHNFTKNLTVISWCLIANSNSLLYNNTYYLGLSKIENKLIHLKTK